MFVRRCVIRWFQYGKQENCSWIFLLHFKKSAGTSSALCVDFTGADANSLSQKLKLHISSVIKVLFLSLWQEIANKQMENKTDDSQSACFCSILMQNMNSCMWDVSEKTGIKSVDWSSVLTTFFTGEWILTCKHRRLLVLALQMLATLTCSILTDCM